MGWDRLGKKGATEIAWDTVPNKFICLEGGSPPIYGNLNCEKSSFQPLLFPESNKTGLAKQGVVNRNDTGNVMVRQKNVILFDANFGASSIFGINPCLGSRNTMWNWSHSVFLSFEYEGCINQPTKSMIYQLYLVGGLEHGFYLSHHIGNVIIPTDELIFFGGVGIPPTSYELWLLWPAHFFGCSYLTRWVCLELPPWLSQTWGKSPRFADCVRPAAAWRRPWKMSGSVWKWGIPAYPRK